MSLDTGGFIEYIKLNEKKKQLSADLEETKQKMLKMQTFLIENLEANEMTKIPIAGKTCYIKNSSFAVINNRADAIDVLKKAGYEDYVKEGINTQSVSKLVRDLLEEDGELPDSFGKIITVGFRSDLNVVAA